MPASDIRGPFQVGPCGTTTPDGPCTLPPRHHPELLHRHWPPANHDWDPTALRWQPDGGTHPRPGCVTFHRDAMEAFDRG